MSKASPQRGGETIHQNHITLSTALFVMVIDKENGIEDP